jgi:phospholipid transport system transporter-binding protein
MLSLPTELTQSQASACLLTLQKGLHAETDSSVVIDATALNRFDSAALAVLLEVRRQTQELGKHFSVQGLPKRLADLAALYGITDLLPAAVSGAVK